MNIRQFKLVSDQVDYQEVEIIIRELERVCRGSIPGDVVEFGCYVGTTSLFISRLLGERRENRTFHVYDSFAGLPEKASQDHSPAGEQFVMGELKAGREAFIRNYRQSGLSLPIIHKGWFDQLQASDIPPTIAFAFLDGDYYQSIRRSLQLIEPCLQAGATLIIDDYQSEALPGARKAADEWARRHNLTITPQHSLGVIHTR